MKERKANNLVAAARSKNDKSFAQTQANNETTNEEKVAFAQTRATNDGRMKNLFNKVTRR